MGQLFQLRQLAVAHDAQQHLLRLVAVASLAMQHGHAAVQLDEDGFADIIGVLADDLYLGAGSAEDEHLVQHHRIHDHHHDAVQTLLQRAERRLQAEDEHIEHQHTGRHRDVEIFVQHQRRDVHAAGGCACPDGDAQRNAYAEACKNGVEHQIIGEHKACEHPLPQSQKQGAEHGAGNGGDGKAPPQQHPAHRKHGHVDDEQHTGHRQSQCTVDAQCDAGGTAGDQA